MANKKKFRTEKDSLGIVKVPADKLWGAQTERSCSNFKIGAPASMPLEIIYALAQIKKAAAGINTKLGVLSQKKCRLICQVCDEILAGKHDDQFPLVIWQTGSGTQSNMNVNEVIANRAQLLAKKPLNETRLVHPNDDANKSQSSNDTFPTALQIAAYKMLVEQSIPAVEALQQALANKAKAFKNIVKIGRTHLMDATPLTLGQVFSGYAAQLQQGLLALKNTLPHLAQIPLGGTAVGTGINTPPGFANQVAKALATLTGLPLKSAKNKFAGLAAHDALVESHGALKQLAVSLYKISNDIRLLGSGPRAGIGELILPANEPGSSIMPGKVNPTQCEALCMVCTQVMGNDVAISFAGSQGQFELNTFKPVMGANFLASARLLGDACRSFTDHCVTGIQANEARIKEHLENSLMLATALNPHIGYEKAAAIAKAAYGNGTTLREEAIKSKFLTAEEFDRWVDPKKMV